MVNLTLWRPTYLFVAVIIVSYLTLPWLMVVPCLVLGMDQLARYGEYRMIMDTRHGASIKQLRRSWCGRGVGIAAYGNEARAVYKLAGYRWWHILPDGFPGIFLNRDFWLVVFYPQEKLTIDES